MLNQIPESEIEFCKKLTELLKEHGVYQFAIDYQPGFRAEFSDTIKLQWSRGRHDAPAKAAIQSTQWNYFEV